MLQKLYAFLARAPALAGVTLAVGDAGPAPGTAGLWCKGVTVLEQRENLLGTVRQRCRAEFTLRLCLPLPPGDSATAAETPPTCWLCRPGWPPSVRRAVPRSLAMPTRPGRPCGPSRANWNAPTQAAPPCTACASAPNTHNFIRRKPHEN